MPRAWIVAVASLGLLGCPSSESSECEDGGCTDTDATTSTSPTSSPSTSSPSTTGTPDDTSEAGTDDDSTGSSGSSSTGDPDLTDGPVSECLPGAEAWDVGTDLCWQKCPPTSAWADNACEGDPDMYDADGAEPACEPDHHLTTLDEILTLFDGCKGDPSADTTVTCNGCNGSGTCFNIYNYLPLEDWPFWTSTPCPHASTSDAVWFGNLSGNFECLAPDTTAHVLCVRPNGG